MNIVEMAKNDVKSFMQRAAEAAGVDIYNILGFDECCSSQAVVIDGEAFDIIYVYWKGGNEGGGEEIVRVWSITHNGTVLSYVRDTGYYESFAGGVMDGNFVKVQPVPITVTRYIAEGETPVG